MRYETIHGLQIPKVGFGTWNIGGGNFANPSMDSKSLAALRSALELGYTHFDTAEVYANGHAEELIGRAVRDANADRSKLFITSKVDPRHLHHDHVLKACENSLRRLKMDYLDLYLIHWPNPIITLEDAFRGLNQLVKEGKVRHLGVSNFRLRLLEKAKAACETPLLTDQVPYRLPDRTYADNGVLEYCQQNEILLTAYSPVKFRNLPANKTLRAIAEAHSATPYQIALAWLVTQPRVITIPMSSNPAHQAENIRAADITLTDGEMEQLNALYESRGSHR